MLLWSWLGRTFGTLLGCTESLWLDTLTLCLETTAKYYGTLQLDESLQVTPWHHSLRYDVCLYIGLVSQSPDNNHDHGIIVVTTMKG